MFISDVGYTWFFFSTEVRSHNGSKIQLGGSILEPLIGYTWQTSILEKGWGFLLFKICLLSIMLFYGMFVWLFFLSLIFLFPYVELCCFTFNDVMFFDIVTVWYSRNTVSLQLLFFNGHIFVYPQIEGPRPKVWKFGRLVSVCRFLGLERFIHEVKQ